MITACPDLVCHVQSLSHPSAVANADTQPDLRADILPFLHAQRPAYLQSDARWHPTVHIGSISASPTACQWRGYGRAVGDADK